MSRTYKDRKDIRLSHPKGFQPSKMATADRVDAYGIDYFHLVDVPVEALTLEWEDVGTTETGPMVRRVYR